jgi:hypothetical protein
MKKILVLWAVMAFMISCNSNQKGGLNTGLVNNPATAAGNTDPSQVPVIIFEKTTHDFGTLKDGEKVSYSFKFTNTGKSELVISNVIASCGCTVPTFPKEPIPPGQSEYINVQFDSKGRSGNFTKEVTIFANTIPNQMQLIIKGSVEK